MAMLAILNFLTNSILFIISGSSLISFGLASTSHMHHLFSAFKNSLALINGFINFDALGSFDRKESFSLSVIKKLPSSVGLLPYIIAGTLHNGLLRLVIKISFAQNVNTFILTVENVDIKTKVEESVFVTCKLVNNSEAEIKISKRFTVNDYLNSSMGTDEIGAIVCKKNKKGQFEKIRINKNVHASTTIEFITILPKSEGFFYSEFIYSDLIASGIYKVKFILKIKNMNKRKEINYKKIYSNWFYLTKW